LVGKVGVEHFLPALHDSHEGVELLLDPGQAFFHEPIMAHELRSR
jgi:hypothetical protein